MKIDKAEAALPVGQYNVVTIARIPSWLLPINRNVSDVLRGCIWIWPRVALLSLTARDTLCFHFSFSTLCTWAAVVCQLSL
jgi:hypothetical protein